MARMYQVSLSGPEDGKPQRGDAVWMRFAHRDETRARDLGRILAERLAIRTGFDVTTKIEALEMVGESEGLLLAVADGLAETYGGSTAPPRRTVEAEIRLSNEAARSIGAGSDTCGLVDRLMGQLRDEHAVELSDWIVVAREMPYEDAASGWRRARITLSLPAVQADMLMENGAAVSACSLRVLEDMDSLYDDGRMEGIAADAQDAALHA